MSLWSDNILNLDPTFTNLCLTFGREENKSPISPPNTLVIETATTLFDRLLLSDESSKSLSVDEVVVPGASRLTDKYTAAYSDFYPSGAPCVYKSGPAWKIRTGPQAQGIVREVRPVYRPDIAPVWVSVLQRLCERLDSMGVEFTSINPLAYANEGEAKPFCPFILSVGVNPYSLTYEAAVAAADGVKDILNQSGLADVEVAFVESVVKLFGGGPKLLPFDRFLINDVAKYRKHFTSVLGLPIAPLKTPYFEGTGSLYLRLDSGDDRVALLTCAHVARPPPSFPANTGMTRTNNNQPRERIVALGAGGYDSAVAGMMADIGGLHRAIRIWKGAIAKLPKPAEGESEKSNVAERRKEFLDLVEKATKTINQLNALHTEVTKCHSTPDLRVIGHVLHIEPTRVSVQPDGYTEDWGLILLDRKQIEWDNFEGNKVFVGGNLSLTDYAKFMFSQPEDQADYDYVADGLLQADGIVQDAEIRAPKHLDANRQECLLVVKNGGGTGTTIGRANGLQSLRRTYPEYGIVKQTTIEIAVLAYNRECGKFSDAGDSGSVVLARDGKILGILTGGAGPTDATDITYVTPFWWLLQRIKEKFPDAFLYPVVE